MKFNMQYKWYVITVLLLGSVVLLGIRVSHKRLSVASTVLPQPTGSYGVGTAKYHLVDTSRKEMHNAEADQSREFMLQVWYPTDACPIQHPAYLLPIAQAVAKALSAPVEKVTQVIAYANIDTPFSTMHKSYPCIIFSHGARTPCVLYAGFLEELASHGYIVCAIDHTYATEITVFPTGKIVGMLPELATDTRWPQEVETFVMDLEYCYQWLQKSLISQHIDFTQVAGIGHSVGGAAVTIWARRYHHACAAVNMDGRLLGGDATQDVGVPYLFLMSKPLHVAADEYAKLSDDKRTSADERIMFWNNLTQPAYYIQIVGAKHFTFTDMPLITATTEEISARLQEHALVRKLLLGYCNAYVGNSSGAVDAWQKLLMKLSDKIIVNSNGLHSQLLALNNDLAELGNKIG